MLQNSKTSTKILVGFSVPMAIIILLAGFGYRSIRAGVEHSGWVEHTFQAIAYGDALVAAMVNQETGERGFALSGDESFLEPYVAGKQALADVLSKAKQHVGDNPAQVARLERVEALARSFDTEAASVLIAKRRTFNQGAGSMGDVLEFVKARVDKKYMDELRGVVKEFTEAERSLLAKRTETAHEQSASAANALLVGGIVAVLMAALATWLLARSVAGTVKSLSGQAERLTEAVREGRLKERATVEAVGPEFRPVLQGMNETMDAFAHPIALTQDYAIRISRGDVPPLIEEQFQGDFNLIKDALNRCIGSINAMVQDATRLARAGVEGQLSTRADAAKHQGDFRKIVEGMNGTLDAVVAPLNVAARSVDLIAKGTIPPRITEAFRGDFEVLKQNLNTCMNAVEALVTDSAALAEQAVQGRLSTRADASRHQGDFRRIVDGVNRTLDAVVGPLTVAARYVEQISRGEIPQRISQEYAGDFAVLRDNLNTCIEAVNRLIGDADALVQAAVDGRLTTRADASKHQGDFRKIVDGVNRTLDAVIAPVHAASTVLEKLAARDLRARVTGEFRGDHARLKDTVNATATALHDALEQVAGAVEQVSGAATQIASSSQAVASGASEQASSIEETSTSIESVSSMTQRSAENAQQASTLATGARAAAGEGASAVEQLQSAMGNIKHSAESTSQIIKDVSDIAFQTNLLALNAAVEAARAGEAGRGFAVVAEEVRSLALRAKEAATKTEDLIRESVKQAGEGTAAAGRVSQKLGEIVQGIGRVSDIVAEIAAAANEQASGIGQVTKAVAEMDKVTQQNAASAEESSSAASELSTQAEQLAAMVGEFTLATQERARARRATAPTRALASAPRTANGAAKDAKRLAAAAFPMDDEDGHAAARDF